MSAPEDLWSNHVKNAVSTVENVTEYSPSQNHTPARDPETLENFHVVPEDLIEERLRHHHAAMRHLLLFARVDSILSAIAGLCLLTNLSPKKRAGFEASRFIVGSRRVPVLSLPVFFVLDSVTLGVSASATLAAYGMGLIAEGGVKQVQDVRWDNTVKIATGIGLVAGGGALGCGVLAAAFSIIEQRTKP